MGQVLSQLFYQLGCLFEPASRPSLVQCEGNVSNERWHNQYIGLPPHPTFQKGFTRSFDIFLLSAANLFDFSVHTNGI